MLTFSLHVVALLIGSRAFRLYGTFTLAVVGNLEWKTRIRKSEKTNKKVIKRC